MQDVDSETASSIDLELPSVAAVDKRGKYRILAELKQLEQEAKSLEEEMVENENTDVSATYNELLFYIETTPDPLLPITNGPANSSWERWFEGGQDSDNCSCWIL